MICTCSKNKALPDIPISECAESFGQIQKIIFFRLFDDDGNVNYPFGSSVGRRIWELSTWQRYLAAEDYSKVVVSPYVQAPTTEGGEPITFGGGNETINGIPVVLSTGSTTFTAQMRNMTQDTIAAMKELRCYELGVMFVNEFGQIGCLFDEANYQYPIPVYSLFVGDKMFGGLESPDNNTISFMMADSWSDKFVVFRDLDFNPLTDLVKQVEAAKYVSEDNKSKTTAEEPTGGI